MVCVCRPDARYMTYGDLIEPNMTSYVLGGLRPATQYVVRLAAVNQAGRGPFSGSGTLVTTLPAGTT